MSDSRPDTHEHIALVRGFLLGVVGDLTERAHRHDRSKLVDPERAIFDEFGPKLASVKYGSDEYHAHLKAMNVALDHHYAVNDHHPQHFPEGEAEPAWGSDLVGIEGMNLMQLTEMLCDWLAATRRHDPPTDIHESIDTSAERFGIGPELTRILHVSADHIIEREMKA